MRYLMPAQVKLYLESTDKQLLRAMLLECGYIPDPKFPLVVQTFFNKLIEVSLGISRKPIPNPVKHYSNNLVRITIPEPALNIPRLQFNLTDWSDFVYNIIHGNIAPIKFEDWPRVSLPLEYVEQYKFPPAQFAYRTQTDLDPNDLPVPISHPQAYIDNRPFLPPIKLNHANITSHNDDPQRYSWYIVELDRRDTLIKLEFADKDAALALAEHFHIVHPHRHQNPNTTITLVLESLYHQLLVPTSIPSIMPTVLP